MRSRSCPGVGSWIRSMAEPWVYLVLLTAFGAIVFAFLGAHHKDAMMAGQDDQMIGFVVGVGFLTVVAFVFALSVWAMQHVRIV